MLVRIAHRRDPDQTASLEAVWSGSALFVKVYLSQLVFEILEHLWYRLHIVIYKSYMVVFNLHPASIVCPVNVVSLVCGFMSQSTAMVMLRLSTNLTTLFPGQA